MVFFSVKRCVGGIVYQDHTLDTVLVFEPHCVACCSVREGREGARRAAARGGADASGQEHRHVRGAPPQGAHARPHVKRPASPHRRGANSATC